MLPCRGPALLLSLACLAACGGDAGAPDLAAAEARFAAGQGEEALRIARALTEAPPADERDLARLANLLTECGDAPAALRLLGDRPARPGAPAEVVEAGALAYIRSREPARAVLALRTLCDANRTGAATHRLLGMALLARGERGPAREAIEEARRRAPDDAAAEALFGWLLLAEGRTDEALAALRAARRRFSASPEVLSTLGLALLSASGADRAGLGEAVEVLSKVRSLRPLDRGSQMNLGTALNRLGRFVEAEAVFERLAAVAGAEAEEWIGLGFARAGRADFRGAVAAFERAADLSPRDARVLMNLGNAYLEVARLDREPTEACARAAAVFERAHQAAPGSPEPLVGLARATLKPDPARDDLAKKAMEIYRRALALDPGHFEANLNLALLYYDLWNADRRAEGEGFFRAKECFERAAAKVAPEQWDPPARRAFEELKAR